MHVYMYTHLRLTSYTFLSMYKYITILFLTIKNKIVYISAYVYIYILIYTGPK